MPAKMTADRRTKAELLVENEQLRARLDEAEQILATIRGGEVDALIVNSPPGDRVFSLPDAEHTYRLIFETMNEAALTVSLDGTILFCNQRFCDLVHSPMVNTIGRRLIDFVTPAQHQPLRMFLADAQTHSVLRFFSLLSTDGTGISCQIGANLLVTDEQTSICLVVSDLTELETLARTIHDLRQQRQVLEKSQAELLAGNDPLQDFRWVALTIMGDAIHARNQSEAASENLRSEIAERKRVEKNLRESEKRFRDIACASADWIWEIDNDCSYVYASGKVKEVLGYEVSELIGRSLFDLMPSDVVRRLRHELQAIMDRQESFHDLEIVDVHKDGTNRHILSSGRPIFDTRGEVWGYRGVDKDITERKRNEAALVDAKAALERERDILQHVMNGAKNSHLVYLDRDFNFVRVNETYAQSCGYRPEEMIGKNHFVLYPDAENEAIFSRVRDTGKPAASHDKPFEFPDQPERGVTYWDWTLTPVKEPKGDVVGLIFSLFETTERKKNETEREQAQEALVGSLQEKETLLQEIHHRVKNNMQIISSLISLQADALTDESLRRALGDVRDRVRSMAIVHEKLYQSGQLAVINFADYTESILNYLWRAYGTGTAAVRLKLKVEPIALMVEQAVLCGLILNELASNALKYAFPDGGSGEVTVGLTQDDAGVVCFFVRDNGIGMPPNQDWRNAPSLGLRLVQMLTRQLRGSVAMRSALGIGTEFRVNFIVKDRWPNHDQTSHSHS